MFGENGDNIKEVSLNSMKGIQAGEFLQSLRNLLPLESSKMEENDKNAMFMSGKVAMNITATWNISTFRKKIDQLGVAPLPTLPGGQSMRPFSLTVKAYYVSAYTKYPNAAKLFAKYATSKEKQLELFHSEGSLPANLLAAADSIITSDPTAVQLLKQYDNSILMSTVPELSYYWEPMHKALVSIWDKKADPKSALDQAVSQIRAALTKASR